MGQLLILCLFIFVIPLFALAEEEVDLEPIVVSSLRTPAFDGDSPETISVVTQKRIQEFSVHNLGEVFKYSPLLDVEPRQEFGRATSPGLQGADSSQVRFMVDDIPFNSLASGQVNPSQFAVENVQRVEVLKGASSGLWGSGLGGSVNVITRDITYPEQPKLSFTSTIADFGTRKQTGEISARAGPVGYYLFSSFMGSDGEGLHDDVKEKKGFGKFALPLSDELTVSGSAGINEGDVNSGVFPDDTWESQPYRTSYGKLALGAKVSEATVNTSIKHSRQHLISKIFYYSTDIEPAFQTTTDNLLYQYSLSVSVPLGEGDTILAGFDQDWDSLRSTYLVSAASQQTSGVYSRYTRETGPWTLHAGLRYDHNSGYGQAFSPVCGALYRLDEQTESILRFTASRAFNAPPLLWRFFAETATEAPNPGLEAEHAWVYELGFQSRPIKRLTVKASGYLADVSDAISAAYNDVGKVTKKNFKKFRRQGGQLEGVIDLLPGMQMNAFAAFNDIRNASADSRVRLASSPRHRYGLGLDYNSDWGFHAGLQGHYDRWGREATVYYNLLGEEVSVDANDRIMLFDLKVSQRYRQFKVFFNVFNLFDSDYWIDYYYPAASRYLEGGVTLDW